MKLSRGERVFVLFIHVFMIAVALFCLLPVLNVFARSLSSVSAVAGRKVWFWPREWSLEGWKYIINRTSFVNSLGNSVFITLFGTLIGVSMTILTAYSLSRPYLKGRKFFIYLYVFMMIFSAGILPNYFQIKSYGLLNSLWALILPAVISPYNIFVLKSSMENIPESLEEAARIDGASFTRVLFSIILPVSKASVATIVIFTSVAYWNRYFDALMYITKTSLKPAALLLYEMVKNSAMEEGLGEIELASKVSPETKNASIVVLTVLPILVVYPFMQKYFVKGVMIGSVKG